MTNTILDRLTETFIIGGPANLPPAMSSEGSTDSSSSPLEDINMLNQIFSIQDPRHLPDITVDHIDNIITKLIEYWNILLVDDTLTIGNTEIDGWLKTCTGNNQVECETSIFINICSILEVKIHQ